MPGTNIRKCVNPSTIWAKQLFQCKVTKTFHTEVLSKILWFDTFDQMLTFNGHSNNIASRVWDVYYLFRFEIVITPEATVLLLLCRLPPPWLYSLSCFELIFPNCLQLCPILSPLELIINKQPSYLLQKLKSFTAEVSNVTWTLLHLTTIEAKAASM